MFPLHGVERRIVAMYPSNYSAKRAPLMSRRPSRRSRPAALHIARQNRHIDTGRGEGIQPPEGLRSGPEIKLVI
jgi:hypothetical protein